MSELIPKLLEVQKLLESLPPADWLLIDPNGNVWRGPEPMILAAQAKGSLPLGFGPYTIS